MKRHGVDYKGINLTNYVPKHQGYDPKVPPGPYSELGLRVKRAVDAAEVAAVRAYLASVDSAVVTDESDTTCGDTGPRREAGAR